MFLALRESEKAGVCGPPPFEATHGGFHKSLCYSPIPKSRSDCQRTKKAEASPVRCKTRTGQFSVHSRGKGSLRIRAPARLNICRVAHELYRIRQTHEGSKSDAHDAVGFRQIGFAELTNSYFSAHGLSCMSKCTYRSISASPSKIQH